MLTDGKLTFRDAGKQIKQDECLTSDNAENWHIVTQAGAKNDFIMDPQLIYKVRSVICHNHTQKNSSNSEKMVKGKLI
jgi:hypothetical protein